MNKAKINKNIVSVKIDEQTKARLQAIGKVKQRSSHWIMKTAISQYLEQEERQELLKEQTMQSWNDVMNNKVVENDKVMKWLDTWGEENEEEHP